MKKELLVFFNCVVLHTTLNTFYYDPVEEALQKNQPERLVRFLLSKNLIISAESKKQYLERVGFLVHKIQQDLETSVTFKELIGCAKGLLFTACGLLSLVIAYFVLYARSNLREDRVSFVIGLSGTVLTTLGIKQWYAIVTKQERFAEYCKALALQELLERLPVAAQ
jgi:hypothetical protein